MSWLRLTWGKMFYEDTGSTGVPLVFLHGTGCDSSDWDAVIHALPPGIRTVRLDFRGHGQSDMPVHEFIVGDLAADVLALREHLGADRMILVGHSLGGMVALNAASRSDRIAGLLLFEGWTSLRAASAFGGERFYGRLDQAAISAIQEKRRMTQERFSVRVWNCFWSSVEMCDARPYLVSCSIPLLEAYGGLGRNDSTRENLLIPDKPNIRIAWIPDAGHYLPHERPGEVARLCFQAAAWREPSDDAADGLKQGPGPSRRASAFEYREQGHPMLRTAEQLRSGKHVTIVAFGDSNTELTFHTHGRLNWVGLLGEAIFETYGNGLCTLVNSGKCASTYRDGLGRLQRDVLRFDPDLVILAFGMNDAGQGLSGLDAFRRDVRETIRRIRDGRDSEILIRTPNPVVTVNGLPPPIEQPAPGRAWESPQRPLKAYAAALVEIANEMGCPAVDHYTLWAQKKFAPVQPVADSTGLWPRMGDAIHPNFLGHLVFFRELAPLFGVSAHFPWEEIDDD